MTSTSVKPCGKVIHINDESARMHSNSLKERYGKAPNLYKCERCTKVYGQTIIHVGYGFDSAKLNKKSRRHHKSVGARKRRRASRLLSELASEV